MARYRHYDPLQTKMIAVSYRRQLLPGSFEHALSCPIEKVIDLGRFAARFKNDETGAPDSLGKLLAAIANKQAGQMWRCWHTRSTTIRTPACSTRCINKATRPSGQVSIHRQRDAVATGQTHPERA